MRPVVIFNFHDRQVGSTSDEEGLKQFQRSEEGFNPMINSINDGCTIDLALDGFQRSADRTLSFICIPVDSRASAEACFVLEIVVFH